MAADKPHLAYYTGSRWANFAVAVLAIAVLSLWLAAGLRETEERTEKLLVELAERRMRMGLQLAIGNAMIHGRTHELRGWPGSNPARWLDGELRGYAGNCTAERGLAEGGWCFDELRGELHYRPRLNQHLRLKNGDAVSLLRWKVVAENATANDGMLGLRVENLTPYEWFAE